MQTSQSIIHALGPLAFRFHSQCVPLVFQELMLWALVAQNFNIEIYHKKGHENAVTDALSHVPYDDTSMAVILSYVSFCVLLLFCVCVFYVLAF